MAIQSRVNQYFGINAHLQSVFQKKDGGWQGFHNAYVMDLVREIDVHLPQGYVADAEQSLQIQEIHPETGLRIRSPRPDITIYDTGQTQINNYQAIYGTNAVATLTQTVLETSQLDEEAYYSATVIYQLLEDNTFGEPVTRIELLSKSNKYGGSGFDLYVEKRDSTLRSGVNLVEIDYLHESHSPIRGIPRYPAQEGSFPNHITVSNPHPSMAEGLAKTYSFLVDVPIPKLEIPLVDDDVVVVDFDAVYQRTFSSIRAYSYRVDYDKLPENFESYSTTDQERIQKRLAKIKEMVDEGVDLEQGPFQL